MEAIEEAKVLDETTKEAAIVHEPSEITVPPAATTTMATEAAETETTTMDDATLEGETKRRSAEEDADATITCLIDANGVNKVEAQVVAEPELISPSDVTSPVEETGLGRDIQAIQGSESIEITQTNEMGIENKDQKPISAGSAENVQADEADTENGHDDEAIAMNVPAVETMPSRGQDGLVEGVPKKVSKVKDEDVKDKNDAESPTEVVGVTEIVEQIKRRTLEVLLVDEKNHEKLASGHQPTGIATAPQEVNVNNDDLCKENSDVLSEETENVHEADAKDPTITNDVVKESSHEAAKAVAEDTKETKAVAGLGELSKHDSNEEEGIQGEPLAKPSQRHSNNIISMVKQSIVKVKKVIVGKSPSSKTVAPP